MPFRGPGKFPGGASQRGPILKTSQLGGNFPPRLRNPRTYESSLLNMYFFTLASRLSLNRWPAHFCGASRSSSGGHTPTSPDPTGRKASGDAHSAVDLIWTAGLSARPACRLSGAPRACVSVRPADVPLSGLAFGARRTLRRGWPWTPRGGATPESVEHLRGRGLRMR